MDDEAKAALLGIVKEEGEARARLMDIVQRVQARFGYVSEEAIDQLAAALGVHRVEVEDMVSFYSFLQRQPKGRIRIRLSKTPVSFMKGAREVATTFEQVLGIPMGGVTHDGQFGLAWTSDIGWADREPAALINETPVTGIAVSDVPRLVATLREASLNSANVLPASDAGSSLMQTGPVLFAPVKSGVALDHALSVSPDEVVSLVTDSKLRGRGGAGFPTGMKWLLCRRAAGGTRYVVCNADEGEPGTFKDRVLLTEVPDLVLEGMTIAGYAIGSTQGIIYLRAEYAWMWPRLQEALERRRQAGLLGRNVGGRDGFHFDIRIQLGAGAYICGEESSLIESLEGKRGAPRDRPPFPTEQGFQDKPTSVNNVETLACVTRILEHGAAWFTRFGTPQSSGTKLMSVSGDCERPGVYEVPFGITVNDLLDLVGGGDAAAVQISGPSGQCVAPKDFGRQLCYEDLSTGGSTMIFGPQRDLLGIVRQFIEFFAEESCGWCTPCRVGTVVMGEMLDKILAGRGTLHDVQELERLSRTVGRTSRCGLGQTAPNPILSTLRSFPMHWEARIHSVDYLPLFEQEKALRPAIAVQKRLPVLLAGET